MTALTTNDVRLINQRANDKLYPIPDYATDPAGWEYRMREIAHGCAKRRGWMDTYTRTAFVKDEVLKVCATKHKLGDTRWFLRILSQQLKARGYGNQNHKTRIIKGLYRYAEALGLSEVDAQGIIERHAKSIQLNENAVMTAIRSAATKQGTLIPEPPRVKAISPFGQPLNRTADELETERQRGLAAIQNLQEQQAMTNQPTAPASEPTPADELTAALQRSAITVDTKTSARFFAQVGAIADEFKLPATNRNEYYHQCLGVDSFDNWQGTFDDAIDQLRLAIIDNVYAPYDAVRNYLSSLFIAAGRKATRDTYLAATGDDGLKDSLEKQRKPSELVTVIRAWLQKPAEKPNATAAKSEPQTGQNSSAGNIPQDVPAKAVAGKIEPQNEVIPDGGQTAPQKTSHAWGFAPTPFLTEVITLTGCPVGELYVWLNKRHNAKYYKSIDARDGSDEKWTDLDPVAVRKRFDKVFGPQGFGWRILPLDNAVVTWQTDSFVTRAGKEKQVKTATASMFVFEYVLVVNGQMQWFRTSAFSDSSTNMSNDAGDALRGVSTSLMKQALKMFGGYDHFIDKAA